MNKKLKIILFSLLCISLISISAISAQEINDEQTISETNDYTNLEINSTATNFTAANAESVSSVDSDISVTDASTCISSDIGTKENNLDNNLNVDAVVIEENDYNNLKDSETGNFSELQEKIYEKIDTGATLELTKNYTRVTGDSNLVINGAIVIDCSGFTINANNKGGIFKVTNTGNLTLKNAVLINCYNNAVIYSEGTGEVSVYNSNFTGNNAYADCLIYSEGKVSIYNSTFTGNIQNGTLLNVESLSVVNSNFTGNNLSNHGNIITSFSTLSVVNSTFISNSAINVIYGVGNNSVVNSTFINNTNNIIYNNGNLYLENITASASDYITNKGTIKNTVNVYVLDNETKSSKYGDTYLLYATVDYEGIPIYYGELRFDGLGNSLIIAEFDNETGMFVYNYTVDFVGQKEVTANYRNASNCTVYTGILNVSKLSANVSITINPSTGLHIDDEVTVTVTVTGVDGVPVTGEVTVKTNSGFEGNDNLVDGKVSMIIPIVENVTIFNVVYSGDTNYTNSSANTTVYADKKSLVLTAENASAKYGQNITINLTASDNGIPVLIDGKNVTVVFANGISKEVMVSDGQVKIYLPYDESYEGIFIVILAESEKYLEAQNTSTLTTEKVTAKVLIDPSVIASYIGDSVTVNISLLDENNNFHNVTDGVSVNVTVKDKDGYDKIIPAEVVNGSVTITLPLDAVSGVFSVSVPESTYIKSSSSNATITINLHPTNMSINAPSVVVYGNDMNITGVITGLGDYPYNKVHVEIKCNNVTYGSDDLNISDDGKFYYNNANPDVGNYSFVFTFDGDGYYEDASATVNVSVVKASPSLNISIEDITYGDNATVNVNLTTITPLNDTVTVIINNESYNITIVDGVGNAIITGLASDNYIATAIYNGNENYTNTSSNVSFTVNKAVLNNVTLSVDESVVYGETTKVTVNVDPDVPGTITLYVDGKAVNTTILEIRVIGGYDNYFYQGYFYLSNLSVGNHTLYVVYNGNENYTNKSSDNVTLTVIDPVITLTLENLTKYYNDTTKQLIATLTFNGKGLANKTITFTVNGREYNRTTDENGTARMNINLDSGVYSVNASYTNNSEVYASNATVTILSTINATDLIKIYKNESQFYATFLNNNGVALANINVTFNINGVYYNRCTNENGTAKLNINLDAGKYVLTAINPKTNEKRGFNVTVLSSIESNNVVKYFRNGTQYSATFKDIKGNVLANTTVKFNINGVFYNRTTNENGTATMNINLQPGNYTLTAINPVTNESIGNSVNVLPVLVGDDIVKFKEEARNYEVKVLDGQGNPLANQTVQMNIHGVLYNKTTDKNGIARLAINLDIGEYVITTTWNGTYTSNRIFVIETIE